MIFRHKEFPSVFANQPAVKKEARFIHKHMRFSSKASKWVKEVLYDNCHILHMYGAIFLTDSGKLKYLPMTKED